MTQLDGDGARRRLPRARTVVSGGLALLVLVLAGAVTGSPARLPAPDHR